MPIARWSTISRRATQAAELVSYDRDRAVLAAFTVLPPALTTLLLVRHAKAGSRSQWRDADELRPLSQNGRKQLTPVRATARVYGADRVFAAPLTRCVATVRPVADDLAVGITEEELLSEKSYAGMEEPAVNRVLEIVAAGGVPVACSQGGVIPDLVSRLADRAELSLKRPVTSKKGSIWALFFDSSRLVAADYLEVP